MSVYAFDLDNTLERPEIAQLANDLYDAGHEVHVVTGGLADSGEWTMEARKARLAENGVRYTSLRRCLDPDIRNIGAIKGSVCHELGASVIFDDRADYLEGVRTTSRTVRLLVLPQ